MTFSIEILPLWALFLLSVVVILIGLSCGYRVADMRRKRSEGSPEGPIGSVVGAVLGLLAFMMAFTFSIAAGQFDTRKQLLLDEVNAIRTAALRSELLPEPHRAECLSIFKQYVDIRVNLSKNPQQAPQAIKETEALQDQLWSHAMELARADMNSDIGALFVESLNNVFDLHNTRVTVAFQYRIPTVVWIVLFALTLLSMVGVGYQFGSLGRSSVAVSMILAFSLSLVVTLIADLERPTAGLLKVNQRPMLELQQKLLQHMAPR